MNRPCLILVVVVLAVLAPELRAQTSYPMLSRVEPTAVQRGTTGEIAITGNGNFTGARQLLCEGPGLAGEMLEGDQEKEKEKTDAAAKGMGRARGAVKARLTVAPDAPLGPREIRVATHTA